MDSSTRKPSAIKRHYESDSTAQYKPKTPTSKRSRVSKSTRTSPAGSDDTSHWPEYFQSLYKLYKALNTVLAFIGSRKQAAPTFDAIRGSVEKIIKQPLDIAKVSEIKAILPNLVDFKYILHDEHYVNDYKPDPLSSKPSPAWHTIVKGIEGEDAYVLILEFRDNWTPQYDDKTRQTQIIPPTRSAEASKRLVEKRNAQFCRAVNELLQAADPEDPVVLIRNAGAAYVPTNPNLQADSLGSTSELKISGLCTRPSLEDVLNDIQQQPWYSGQILYQQTIPPKQAAYAELKTPLSQTIAQALRDSRGITTLYSHQVQAIDSIHDGKNVIVSTSTASGKSVVYQVPLLRLLEQDPETTAIFVYPTKALAQDQLAALQALLGSCSNLQRIKASTYDGDTPTETRASIRDSCSVIFTNFDMIHAAILPQEEKWRKFLKRLKLFVVDELHYYSGLLGSHVALIMRRLRRICAAVGNRRSRFITCSATISKPLAHMVNIFGLKEETIKVITEDGAPSGRRDVIIWSPPPLDSSAPSLGRQGPITESTTLMSTLIKQGIRAVMFCKTRTVCELAMQTLRRGLIAEGRRDILDRVHAYRGGYSPEDRRKIESDAFSGQVLGIIATNALELGVDIGVLDAVIMLGFPLTMASFRQQAGRAGRRARDSLAAYVPTSSSSDQYYVNNPRELIEQPIDDLVVDMENILILEAHLQCAAFEMPLSLEDTSYFGSLTVSICETKLSKDADGWYHPHTKFLPYPSRHVSIRGIQQDRYTLVDVSKTKEVGHILEDIEESRVLFQVYEGGVYLHQGTPYIIKEVDHRHKVAKLIRSDVSWITSPRDFTDVNALETYRIREIKGSPYRGYFGRVEVRSVVFGYFKIRNGKILDIVDLETDPWERETTGLWIDVPSACLELMRQKHVKPAAGIHAAQHAFLNQFFHSQDVRTECKVEEKEILQSKESKRKRPARLIFYDMVGQGGGVTAKAFDNITTLVSKAHATIASCPCQVREGCVKCVQNTACKGGKVLSKLGALMVIQAIAGMDISPDQFPDEVEEEAGQDSIVGAEPIPGRGSIAIES